MSRITKRGALQVTSDLDKLSNLMQHNHVALGIPEKVAHDFLRRVDLIADQIERTAGILPGEPKEAAASNGGYDPAQIGETGKGPLVQEPDESYMSGEFTQRENTELHDVQQGGAQGLGSKAAKESDCGDVVEEDDDKEGSKKANDLIASLEAARRASNDLFVAATQKVEAALASADDSGYNLFAE